MLDTYWAAVPSEDIGRNLAEKLGTYANDTIVTSVSARHSRAYEYYYGLDPSGVHATSNVLRKGDEGELAAIRVNHSRPLVNTLLNLIVAPKIVWSPKATNDDAQSFAQLELAEAILEYYWRDKHVSKYATKALEEALVFTEGFVLVEWDAAAGDDVASLNGTSTERAGDLRYSNVSAWDVIRDPTKTSWDSLDWVMVRLFRNRWDLIAQYPEQAEAITRAQEKTQIDNTRPVQVSDSDDVEVYRFFHRRSPAIPSGRDVMFLADGTVLEGTDQTLAYDEIPLYRVSAGEMTGTPFGYSAYLDILGVQELMDSLHTIIASNQSTFGAQSVAIEEGTTVDDPDVLVGGMRVFTYRQGSQPPQALNLTRTPTEIFQYADSLKKQQELLFGLNSVVRGEPQSGEQSGSALVMLQQQALQQSSTIQASWLRFVEGIGGCTLNIIKRYATMDAKIAIVGKTNQSVVSETTYNGDSLSRIKAVQVEIGNPLSQTASGRIEMARDLMQSGFIKSPEQYMQVLLFGRLEPLTQGLSKELILIKAENEQLQAGELPPTSIYDDHLLHFREHRAMAADPMVRRDKTRMDALMAHLGEHEQLYFTATPQQLFMSGQPPPPQMGPPGMPPGGPPPAPEDMGGPPPELPGGPQPEPPKPPTNPSTGQQWNPIDAGGAVPR